MDVLPSVRPVYKGVTYIIPEEAVTDLLNSLPGGVPHSEDNKEYAAMRLARANSHDLVEPLEYLLHGLDAYQKGLTSAGHYRNLATGFPHDLSVGEYMDEALTKGYKLELKGKLYYNPGEVTYPMADEAMLIIHQPHTGEVATRPLSGLSQWNSKDIDKKLVEMYLDSWKER